MIITVLIRTIKKRKMLNRSLLLAATLLAIAAADSIVLDSITIEVQKASKTLASLQVDYPNKAGEAIKVPADGRLFVSFIPKSSSTGEPLKLHQTFLRLMHTITYDSVYTTARRAKDATTVSADLTSVDINKQLGENIYGTFTASLLLGDINISPPISWEFLDVEMLPPDDEVNAQQQDGITTISPSGRSAHGPLPGSNKLNAIWTSKPDITHQHRRPEKRIFPLIPIIFTFTAFIPVSIFILILNKLGALNVKGLSSFSSTSSTFWPLLFHGGIASLLLLYFLFWLRLNLMTTTPIAIGIGCVTAVAGRKVLKGKTAASLISPPSSPLEKKDQ